MDAGERKFPAPAASVGPGSLHFDFRLNPRLSRERSQMLPAEGIYK